MLEQLGLLYGLLQGTQESQDLSVLTGIERLSEPVVADQAPGFRSLSRSRATTSCWISVVPS